MSNYNSLKATIDANIKQNGRQEITGQILNSVLNQMVTTLGAGYQFAGVATTATNPGTPDVKVFYIANGKGTYTNFGGINVTEDDVVVLYWDTAWHKVSTGIASNEKLTELESTTSEISKEDIETEDESISIEDNNGNEVLHLDKNGLDAKDVKRNGKDVLTEHQDISGLATKEEVEKKQDILPNVSTEVTIKETEEIVFGKSEENRTMTITDKKVAVNGALLLNGIPIGSNGKKGSIELTKNGSNLVLTFRNGGVINARLNGETDGVGYYDANPIFNFRQIKYKGHTAYNTDDVAALHIMNNTFGSNHAQPHSIATIANHGLTYSDIGTEWSQTISGTTKKYYVVRIVDNNRVAFLSQNFGTIVTPSFHTLKVGTITNGSRTLSVTYVETNKFMYAGVNNVVQNILADGVEITENGTYNSNSIDIVEEYDIMHPVYILNNIIAKAGTFTQNPIFDGQSAMKVKTTYRFNSNMSCVCIVTYEPKMEIAMQDLLFIMEAPFASIGDFSVYVPNSLPCNGYDFRKPKVVNWSESVPELFFTASECENGNTPINRAIQIANNVGIASGYITDYGIGSKLKDNASYYLELRNNTGKVYHYAVTSEKYGNTLNVGDVMTCVSYKAVLDVTPNENRLCMYHIPVNDSVYVFADYSSPCTDKLTIDENLNGREVSVVESLNCDLITDVYNDGVYVKSTNTTNTTSYIILKIK